MSLLASQDECREVLVQLLPPGAALAPAREEGTGPWRLLHAMAGPLAALGRRVAALLEAESDPARALEMLPNWERAFGLPDTCSGAAPDTLARRNQLLARIAAQGGQSRLYFQALARALGYQVEITAFRPWRVGHSSVADPLRGEAWIFAWQVTAPPLTIREWAVGRSSVADPLRAWDTGALECTLQRLKPARSVLLFSYG